MTLVQLEYLLAVAEHGNFTLAAEKSHLTQPTLSMQIQKLEEQLGVKFLIATPNPSRPQVWVKKLWHKPN